MPVALDIALVFSASDNAQDNEWAAGVHQWQTPDKVTPRPLRQDRRLRNHHERHRTTKVRLRGRSRSRESNGCSWPSGDNEAEAESIILSTAIKSPNLQVATRTYLRSK